MRCPGSEDLGDKCEIEPVTPAVLELPYAMREPGEAWLVGMKMPRRVGEAEVDERCHPFTFRFGDEVAVSLLDRVVHINVGRADIEVSHEHKRGGFLQFELELDSKQLEPCKLELPSGRAQSSSVRCVDVRDPKVADVGAEQTRLVERRTVLATEPPAHALEPDSAQESHAAMAARSVMHALEAEISERRERKLSVGAARFLKRENVWVFGFDELEHELETRTNRVHVPGSDAHVPTIEP